MSIHATLTSHATEVLVAVQGETGRVRVRENDERDWLAVTALVGGIGVDEEDREYGATIRTRSVEKCTVRVPSVELGQRVPHEGWQLELDGQLWPVERVTGRDTAHVAFHLERARQKSIGGPRR